MDAQLRVRRPRPAKARADAVLEARLFGGWTFEKLELLRLYLKMYRRVAGGGTYIDGFAGTGRANVVGHGEVPGSVELAIRAATFKRLLVYEADTPTAAALDRNLQERFGVKTMRPVWMRPGVDFNTAILQDLAAEHVDRSRSCFAFLDPNSTQLGWQTLEALAAYKGGHPPKNCKIELLILFNTDQAFVRLVPRTQGLDYPNTSMAKTLNWVMGGPEAWQDLNGPQFTGTQLMYRYRDRLQDELGYEFVRGVPIKDPISGRRQYFMVHASDHPKAQDFITWAADEYRKTSGTVPMFDDDLFG